MSVNAQTSASAAEGAQHGVPDPKRWLALAVIAVAQLLIILDATVVTVALPTMQKSLHISAADRSWALTAYTLAFGGLLLLGGRIADYTGRKRAFIIGLIGFAAASALSGLAQNEGMLFSARALQGAMAALMAPAALSLLTVAFTQAKERAMAFGIYGMIAGGGSAVGLILGGVLTQYASWRWALLISTPVAALAAFGAIAWVHESKAHGNTRYDLPGAITSTLGLIALVYGFTRAAPAGPGEGARWGSAWAVSLFAAAAVLLVSFVLIEVKSKNPLLPMRVLRDRNRGGSFLIALIVPTAIFGVFVFLSYYMQQVLGYSQLKAGIAFLPFTAGVVIGAMMSTQIMPRVGARIPITLGPAIAAVGMFLLTFLQPGSSYWLHVFLPLFIISFGMGNAFGPVTSTALIGVKDHDAGVASALVNADQQIGGSIGLALLNTIAVTATTSYLTAHHTGGTDLHGQMTAVVHGYTTAFWVSAGLMVLATLVAATFIRVRPEQLQGSGIPGAL
jgi:EmrB/QacA subfamily drug resistance transporter